jgi:hypothetical protein
MDIEQSNKKAMRGKTSRFGKCMAKTHKIVNIVMVVDARAQGMSLSLHTMIIKGLNIPLVPGYGVKTINPISVLRNP